MSLHEDLTALVLATRDPRRTEPGAGVRAWLGRQLVDTASVERLDRRAFWVLCAPQTRARGDRQLAIAAVDPADPEAVDWLVERFATARAHIDSNFVCILDVAYAKLIPRLQELGFGPVKVELQGTVADAWEVVRQREMLPGIEVRPFVESDIEPILAARGAFFRAHPELGFATAPTDPGSQARIDAAIRAQLLERVRRDPPTDFVFIEGGQRIGHVGYQPRNGAGGIDMFFVPEVHGRGLGWLGYRVLVHSMRERGLERLEGQTSNPAVVHIGRAIGRWVRAIHVSYDRPSYPSCCGESLHVPDSG